MRALRFHYNLLRIAATKVLGELSPQAFVAALAPLQLESIPEPDLPRPDWVRLRPRLTGICGSDLKQVKLNGAWDNPLTALVSLPHVLGHEAVAEVEAVGPAVTALKVGQRVAVDPWLPCRARGVTEICAPCRDGDHTMCRNFDAGSLPPGIHLGNNAAAPGVFADHFVAHESQCHLVPDAISDEAAVLADPFSVSLHSVLRAPPAPDAPALVIGLGTLGLTAIAALRALYPRVRVIGVGRHPHQTALAAKLGAEEVIVGSSQEIIERIAEITEAKVLVPWNGLPWLLDGVGVTYDTVGSPSTIEVAIRVTRTRGTVVVSGVEIPKRFEWTPIYFKELSVVGSNAFAAETIEGKRVHAFEAYLGLVAKGLDITPIITHRFPLDRWREAFRALMSRRSSAAVKVLLVP